jgi:phosphatidylinositol alpha-1,6-mannosyltransferase
VHRKGQDHLIQALPEILKSVPDAHLLLVGQGPYREHLEKLVQQLGLKDHVSFIGRIQYDQLPQYICAGDVFAMPSRSRFFGLEVEGLGIVYLEASACGLPVIAGSSGGAPDAVLDGVTGFVVDGQNNQEIATAAITLLSDLDQAKKMGVAGRNWIVENWRWEIWSQRFNELLH